MPNEKIKISKIEFDENYAIIPEDKPKEKSVLSEDEQDYEDKNTKEYDDFPEEEL